MRAFFILIVAALGASAADSKKSKPAPLYSGSTLPTHDSFYKYRSQSLEHVKPGHILASRAVNTTIANYPILASKGIKSYQVAYRTTGANGEALSAVTTVWIPTKGGRKNQLIAYSTPEDSSFINCAPSYSYLTNSTVLNTNNNNEEPIIALLLNKGFTVTSSDYETNELSAFTAGHVEGHGVLDGLRATLNFKEANLDRHAKVAAMGYSGGAIATGWAAALQPTYASELNVVGMSFGGTPANITDALQHLDGGAAAGYDIAGFAGQIAAYPKFGAYIKSILTQAGKDAIAFAQNNCVTPDLIYFGGKMFESTAYETQGSDILKKSIAQETYKQSTLGSNKKETPRVPLHVVHCSDDEILPIGEADFMVDSWCHNKAPSIVYNRDVSGTCRHGTEWVRALPDVFKFLDERFAGSKQDLPKCSINNVTLAVPDSSALGANEQPLFAQIIAANQV